jgi:hypothetical protein
MKRICDLYKIVYCKIIVYLFIAKLLLSYFISTSPNNVHLFITKVVIICIILFPLPQIISTFPLSFILFYDVV